MTNENVVNNLKTALADSYVLYLKTQNYHWNVTGPNFKSFHLMFEEQYNDLFAAVDLIAERIRALGVKAPGTYAKYIELTNLKEGNEELEASAMIKDLANDQDTIVATFNKTLKAAQEVGDEVTAGIVADRIEIHEKNAWMLKSSL